MVVVVWEFEVGPSKGRGGSAVTKFLVGRSLLWVVFSGGSSRSPSCTGTGTGSRRERARAERNRNRGRLFIRYLLLYRVAQLLQRWC